jgi:hypothetical protein
VLVVHDAQRAVHVACQRVRRRRGVVLARPGRAVGSRHLGEEVARPRRVALLGRQREPQLPKLPLGRLGVLQASSGQPRAPRHERAGRRRVVVQAGGWLALLAAVARSLPQPLDARRAAGSRIRKHAARRGGCPRRSARQRTGSVYSRAHARACRRGRRDDGAH